ncbi:MAG: penicillin-insensitive murein endopeptidase [Saprospiraceae bacterium]|nr:penicillin-insensitive murein endopeptidase [Saprospiraceae bacterium]
MIKQALHPLVWLPALLIASFYYLIPVIADYITSYPAYAKYANGAAAVMVKELQAGLLFPFGKYLRPSQEQWLVFPYWLLLFWVFRLGYLAVRPYAKWIALALSLVLLTLYIFPDVLLVLDNEKPSISRGGVANGQVENAKRLPFRGDNYTTYSFSGYLLGRTYAHDRVKATVLDAYGICESSCPEITFVLGEIGCKGGGRFIPHITHQNGMSVDFMTPMLRHGQAYKSHHLLNIWGYGWEFDKNGRKGEVEIDYETAAKHIFALTQAAKENGLRIAKVIFDPVLRPQLLDTKFGPKIKHLPFTRNRVIIRHDDHYHIDFEVK